MRPPVKDLASVENAGERSTLDADSTSFPHRERDMWVKAYVAIRAGFRAEDKAAAQPPSMWLRLAVHRAFQAAWAYMK